MQQHLESVLSEVSHIEKDRYNMISHIWNLKYDTNELIYKIEIYSHTDCGCHGEEGWRGMNWKFGISRCKLLCIICIGGLNNKMLFYSTVNYVQYPVMNHNEKEKIHYLC